jgi:hypothetical protein
MCSNLMGELVVEDRLDTLIGAIREPSVLKKFSKKSSV